MCSVIAGVRAINRAGLSKHLRARNDFLPEEALVSLFTRGLKKPKYLISDFDSDTDIIDILPKGYVLLKVDTINEGIDFPWDADMQAAGYFCASTALTDIAACGGEPLGVLAGWSIPRDLSRSTIVALSSGFRECLQNAGTYLLGGDTNYSDEFALSVVCVGQVPKVSLMTRHGAQEGDRVGLVGESGRFNAGYIAHHELKASRGVYRQMLVQRPMLVEGRILGRSRLASSCTDTVDGLEKSLRLLCESSNTGALIDDEAIKLSHIAGAIARRNHMSRLEMASKPAGDLCLLFTCPEAHRLQIETSIPGRVSWIGQLTCSKGITLNLKGKASSSGRMGFSHGPSTKLFPSGARARADAHRTYGPRHVSHLMSNVRLKYILHQLAP